MIPFSFLIFALTVTLNGFVLANPAPKTFIDGGQRAEPGQFPFLAGIFANPSRNFFHGVLLNERTILTSARSVYGSTSFDIFLGATSLNASEPNEQYFRVSNQAVTIHPEYDPNFRPARDVALIKLDKPVIVTQWVKPAPLLPRSAIDLEVDFARQNGTVIGWNKQLTQVVYYTNGIPLNVLCEFAVYTYHMCLYGSVDQGPWTSESGAPLVSDYEGRDVLVGVLSYAADRGTEFGQGSVYSRLTYFAKWIEENSDVKFV